MLTPPTSHSGASSNHSVAALGLQVDWYNLLETNVYLQYGHHVIRELHKAIHIGKHPRVLRMVKHFLDLAGPIS